MKRLLVSAVCAFGTSVSLAALPPPTPQQAEAAELAKARTAYANVVANFQLCQSINAVAMKYKKAGVILGGIVPDDALQGDLFSPPVKQYNRALMGVLDNINFSMRDDMVKFGASGLTRNWKMRQEMRSSRYTTRWGELLTVNC